MSIVGPVCLVDVSGEIKLVRRTYCRQNISFTNSTTVQSSIEEVGKLKNSEIISSKSRVGGALV